MVLARRANRECSKEHIRDFDGFGVHFDHYDSTHSDANKARSTDIYIKTVKLEILQFAL